MAHAATAFVLVTLLLLGIGGPLNIEHRPRAIHLILSLVKSPKSDAQHVLKVSLSNAGKYPVLVDSLLNIDATIWFEVKDQQKRVLPLQRTNHRGRVPFSSDQFTSLSPGAEITRTYRWEDYFKPLGGRKTVLRVRAYYGTALANEFAGRRGIYVPTIKVDSNWVTIRGSQ